MAELGPATTYGGNYRSDRTPDLGGAPCEIQSMRELCHDLRHPVATIAAFLAAAQVESDLSPTLRRRFEQISEEVRSIFELCRQVLGETRWGPVRLDLLVAEAVEGVLLTSASSVESACEPAVVRGDAAALRRAVWNLIDNATRAAGDDGRVRVEVRTHDGDTVVVCVTDSGGGFGWAGAGVAGLGLGIASRVAREHDGRLTVGRASELGGAAVTIVLPLAVDEALNLELGAGLRQELETSK